MAKVLVIHGAGMNMRGKVSLDVFGPMTLPEYDERIRGYAGALGLDVETGSLARGKRADLTVVSLADSPYLPVEDPAAAVVFGGSPARVLATFVDGEARYEKGGMDWHELTAAAHSARRAMLAVPPAAEPVVAAPHA